MEAPRWARGGPGGGSGGLLPCEGREPGLGLLRRKLRVPASRRPAPPGSAPSARQELRGLGGAGGAFCAGCLLLSSALSSPSPSAVPLRTRKGFNLSLALMGLRTRNVFMTIRATSTTRQCGTQRGLLPPRVVQPKLVTTGESTFLLQVCALAASRGHHPALGELRVTPCCASLL